MVNRKPNHQLVWELMGRLEQAGLGNRDDSLPPRDNFSYRPELLSLFATDAPKEGAGSIRSEDGSGGLLFRYVSPAFLKRIPQSLMTKMCERLHELEEQKAQKEEERERIGATLDVTERQVLNAQAMAHTLNHFGDIINGATDQEKKDLLAAILAEVTYKPDEIKIALFDHFVEESFVNQSSDGALELSAWLRWQDSNLRRSG